MECIILAQAINTTIVDVNTDPCNTDRSDFQIKCENGYFCDEDKYRENNNNISVICTPICYQDANEQCCSNGAADQELYCTSDPYEACAPRQSATSEGELYVCRCVEEYVDIGGTCYDSLSVMLVVGGCFLFVVLVLTVALVVVSSKYNKQKKKAKKYVHVLNKLYPSFFVTSSKFEKRLYRNWTFL